MSEEITYTTGTHEVRKGEVIASGDAVVIAKGNSKIHAYHKSEVTAKDNSVVYAFQYTKVYSDGNSIVHAFGDSEVSADGNSIVHASLASEVQAFGDSKVIAKEFTVVTIWDGNPEVILEDQSVCIDRRSNEVLVRTAKNIDVYTLLVEANTLEDFQYIKAMIAAKILMEKF